MAIAAHHSRDEKFRWLMQPLNWALSASFFGMIFGAVLWIGAGPKTATLETACAFLFCALVVTCALVWIGMLRMSQAAGKL